MYTRSGHYAGYTSSEEGWTLIYDSTVQQRGLTSMTRLGPFIDEHKVNIPAGDTASFYVYTTQNLSYQYSEMWTEGNAILEDDNLRLFAGVALAYGKWEEGCVNEQCMFAPRVFSGMLEYSV